MERELKLKKRLVFLVVVLIAFVMFFAATCFEFGGNNAPTTQTTLATPQNLRIEDMTLRFNSVENASRYRVHVLSPSRGETFVRVASHNSFDLSFLGLEEGQTYLVQVRAEGGVIGSTRFLDSYMSQSLSFIAEAGNIVLDGLYLLTANGVSGLSKFMIMSEIDWFYQDIRWDFPDSAFATPQTLLSAMSIASWSTYRDFANSVNHANFSTITEVVVAFVEFWLESRGGMSSSPSFSVLIRGDSLRLHEGSGFDEMTFSRQGRNYVVDNSDFVTHFRIRGEVLTLYSSVETTLLGTVEASIEFRRHSGYVEVGGGMNAPTSLWTNTNGTISWSQQWGSFTMICVRTPNDEFEVVYMRGTGSSNRSVGMRTLGLEVGVNTVRIRQVNFAFDEVGNVILQGSPYATMDITINSITYQPLSTPQNFERWGNELNWSWISNANGYRVYIRRPNSSEFTFFGSTWSTWFWIGSQFTPNEYTFRVQAIASGFVTFTNGHLTTTTNSDFACLTVNFA